MSNDRRAIFVRPAFTKTSKTKPGANCATTANTKTKLVNPSDANPLVWLAPSSIWPKRPALPAQPGNTKIKTNRPEDARVIANVVSTSMQRKHLAKHAKTVSTKIKTNKANANRIAKQVPR